MKGFIFVPVLNQRVECTWLCSDLWLWVSYSRGYYKNTAICVVFCPNVVKFPFLVYVVVSSRCSDFYVTATRPPFGQEFIRLLWALCVPSLFCRQLSHWCGHICIGYPALGGPTRPNLGTGLSHCSIRDYGSVYSRLGYISLADDEIHLFY